MNAELREHLGRAVRDAYAARCKLKSNVRPDQTAPWESMSDFDQETDRVIGEAVLAAMDGFVAACREQLSPEHEIRRRMGEIDVSGSTVIRVGNCLGAPAVIVGGKVIAECKTHTEAIAALGVAVGVMAEQHLRRGNDGGRREEVPRRPEGSGQGAG